MPYLSRRLCGSKGAKFVSCGDGSSEAKAAKVFCDDNVMNDMDCLNNVLTCMLCCRSWVYLMCMPQVVGACLEFYDTVE